MSSRQTFQNKEDYLCQVWNNFESFAYKDKDALFILVQIQWDDIWKHACRCTVEDLILITKW